MSNLNLNYRQWILIWIVAILVTGCSSPAPTTDAVLGTPSGIPTRTPSPSPTVPEKTETATITATGTATVRPTSTASLTPTPSWTPRPTLPPEEARLMVEELMETNGGCELPCWWGIVPGETTWEETEAFLSPFALLIGSPFSDGNYIHYDVYVPISESEYIIDNKRIVFWKEKSGHEIEMILSGREYSLVNFLEKFGKPDQIWFRSPGLPAVGPPQFDVNLIYKEKGIAAGKEGFGTFIDEGDPIVEVCLENIDPIQGFFLWSPENTEIVDEVIIPGLSGPGQEYPLRQLGDVTNFDVDDFYTTFSNPDATECIRSPMGIWP